MKRIILLIIVAFLALSKTEGILAKERTSPLVIVLDPGHDTTHAGAGGNGLREEELNLKIAQYCLEELRTYNNVEVHMTRYAQSCPHSGLTTAKDNLARVEFAESVNADVYVSLHLNSDSTGKAKGVEIFYPNTSFRPALSTEGKELATSILEELVGLGLYNRGVLIRDAETSRYEDGSIGDYYQVIREAKKCNIPGIIVEHAFISNASDAANFLSTEAQLKALGVADATGIAKYYGLSKSEDAKEKEYTVTFMYGDKVISTQQVPFGQGATRPDVAKEGMYTVYDKSFSYITEDTVIHITYEPIVNSEDTSGGDTDPTPGTEDDKETKPPQTEDTESEIIDTEDTETEDTTEESTQVEDTETEIVESEDTETEIVENEDTETKDTETQGIETDNTQVSDTNSSEKPLQDAPWLLLIIMIIVAMACIGVIVALLFQLRKNKQDIEEEA
jgi:N-acetylmuramoyl-L-alanine amidase